MSEECHRKTVRLFWLLPLVLAPGLIMLGYYEAYHEHHFKNLAEKADDSACSTKSFSPLGSRPCFALASFPGSGNTWFRHLLESASGIYTGSIYKDKKLFRAGFYGEYEELCQGTLLVVKTHRFKGNKYYPNMKFDGTVLIVRNPMQAMISEWNRKRSEKDHVATAPQEEFTGLEWSTFVESSTDKWLSVLENWLHAKNNIHVVYYEDMVANPRKELIDILEFLKVPVDPSRMDCTITNQEGNFHRKSQQEFDPFSSEMKSNIHRAMVQAQEELVEYNMKPLPPEYLKEEIR